MSLLFRSSPSDQVCHLLPASLRSYSRVPVAGALPSSCRLLCLIHGFSRYPPHLQHFLRLLFPAGSGVTKHTEQRHYYTLSEIWRDEAVRCRVASSCPLRRHASTPNLLFLLSQHLLSPKALSLSLATSKSSILGCKLPGEGRETLSFLDPFLYCTNYSAFHNLNTFHHFSSIIYKLGVILVLYMTTYFLFRGTEAVCLDANPGWATYYLCELGQTT